MKNRFRPLRGLLSLARRLRHDTRGNVLMLTGLSILPLTFVTGMGIDYSRAMRVQTRLNAVADAAALTGVTQPMMTQSILNACTAATGSFLAQSAGLDGVVLDTADPAKFSIVIADTFASLSPVTLTCPAIGVSIPAPIAAPLSRVVTVTYRGASTNSFSAVLGVNSLTIKGNSVAKAALAPFIDIHMALDTSQSMGLAATPADAAALYQKTGQYNGESCTFGCHASKTFQTYTNDAIAAYFGIKLRIDVLKQASQDMIQSAITAEGTQSLYRFGLYRIGTSLSDITPLTGTLSKPYTDAGNLTLGPNNSGGVGDSNLPDATDNLMSRITAHGDGTTQANARAFLFFVTDGVKDVYGSCTSGHCTAPIDPTTCQRYKDAGITVGVVYTTYLPILANPTNGSTALQGDYVNLVKPFSDQIGPKLQACASAGWYFEAANGSDIHAAMQKLFAQASQTATISH